MRRLGRLLPRKGQRLGLLPRKGDVSRMAGQWTSLRWAALPVSDRRWTAPLLAAALGMGLFAGVAIGPGVEGVVGAPAQIVEVAPEAQIAAAPPPLAPPGGNAGPKPSPSPSPEPAPSPPSSTPSIEPSVPISPSIDIPEVPITPVEPTTTDEGESEETTTEETTTTTEGEGEETTTEELTLAGTVVNVNAEARSYALADREGQMSAIHDKHPPKPGTKLEVPVRQLANGTYAEAGNRDVKGKKTSAKIGGLVTFRDPALNAFTISRTGASVLVYAGGATVPDVGALVTAAVGIGPRAKQKQVEDTTTTTPTTTPTTTTTSGAETANAPPGCGTPPPQPRLSSTVLTARQVTLDTDFLGYGDFAGIVQGVCTSSRELLLSADGSDEADQFLTFKVGSEFDLGRLSPGQVVDVSATIERTSKALTLTGISRDRGAKEADDVTLAQGEGAAPTTDATGGESEGDASEGAEG